jgi:hypothetical protein
MNGQIYGHKYACNWEGKGFVFLHCGRENLDEGDDPLFAMLKLNRARPLSNTY